jgi:phosphohistidine phosphatase
VPKRLILLRHAKSAWDNPSAADFDRPLSSRGRKAAPVVGAWLARRGLIPGLVLCSSARRASETLDLASAGWQTKPTVRKLKTLYLAMPREMLRRVQATGKEPEHRATLARKFPTGAVAVIDFDVEDWAEVDAETGTLVEFATPKQIESGD